MTPTPKVGDDIYIPTQVYIGHGEDDIIVGLAKVQSVRHGKDIDWIRVHEDPGKDYNWNYLSENQEKWKAKFGDSRAYLDPDYTIYYEE